MCADRVLAGQNLEDALTVEAGDLFGVDFHLTIEDRIRGDELLGEGEIVTGLLLIVGDDEAIAAGRALAGQKLVETGEN
jgi:hypothetical protein